jgi:hypothetical protein
MDLINSRGSDGEEAGEQSLLDLLDPDGEAESHGLDIGV